MVPLLGDLNAGPTDGAGLSYAVAVRSARASPDRGHAGPLSDGAKRGRCGGDKREIRGSTRYDGKSGAAMPMWLASHSRFCSPGLKDSRAGTARTHCCASRTELALRESGPRHPNARWRRKIIVADARAGLPRYGAVDFRKQGYIGLMAVSSPDLKAFLVATPFFGGLSGASLELLISMLVERRFEIGATIVAEREPGRSMYIVHSGELAVSKLGDAGCVVPISRLGPGDFFGEMTLIEVQNRSATVVADSPVVLYELTARNLYTYYKADIWAYAMVMQNINRELCRRLRRADNRIAELQTLHGVP
jgi:CRP/FNR family transcriptional regulator, cyclic AMP receptor protein